MLVAALVLTALAGLLHVWIFWMESLAWTSQRVRRTFGTSAQEAEATREMAFNQGFYNLFLGIAALLGALLLGLGGHGAVGRTLVWTGLGSMFLAALVLFCSSADKRRAAVSQGLLPLLGMACLALA